MNFVGTHWWVEKASEEDKVTKAIVRKEDKEIIIDYKLQGHDEHMKLTSDDGLFFQGNYERKGKIMGKCGFTLYENIEGGYFLYGGYSSPEDERGIWWIELKPER